MKPFALVTGGAGFIGSHIVDLLLESDWDVLVLDDLSTGERANVAPGAEFVEGSVTDTSLVSDCVKRADYVFHTAALARIQPSFDDPVPHEDINVIGTLRVMEAAKGSTRLKKIVISASSACYGTPDIVPTPETAAIQSLSPYAVQKYSAEQQALLIGGRFGIPTIALRYFNVYGPRSFNPRNPYNAYTSVIGIFAHQRRCGTALTVTGDGLQTRDFVYVSDVARANVAAAESLVSGDVFNVGTGITVPILRIAQMFGGPIEHVPERSGEARVTWANIAKTTARLEWKPVVPLERGVDLSR